MIISQSTRWQSGELPFDQAWREPNRRSTLMQSRYTQRNFATNARTQSSRGAALGWLLVVLNKITLVTEGLNIVDVVRATQGERNNVVLCPLVAISTVRTFGDIVPNSSTSWTRLITAEFRLPLCARVGAAIQKLSITVVSRPVASARLAIRIYLTRGRRSPVTEFRCPTFGAWFEQIWHFRS